MQIRNLCTMINFLLRTFATYKRFTFFIFQTYN